jgi:serine/threonine protein phosphatase PrpC
MPLHGHDAFAFSSTTLVVADGVGSWTDRDVDPAIWSHMLVSEVIMNQDADDDPDSILDNLFRAVARCRAPGSSTLVVAVMEPDGPHALLYNLGDSSWWQVRDSQIIARSRDLLHGPNQPYQVGRNQDLSMIGDSVDEGRFDRLDLVVGDRLVLATDGLSKLLDSDQIAEASSIGDPAVATSLMAEVLEDLRDHANRMLRDDITVLVAEVISSPASP